jgi:PAS domain-containing protein
MSQKAIEVILARHLASYLGMPIIVVDPAGTLLFYNEPAELILGLRFEETGAMPLEEWASLFVPTDEHGLPLPRETRPLIIAVTERRPAHREMWLQGADHVQRHIELTAFPLLDQAGRHLGAIAILWEVQDS